MEVSDKGVRDTQAQRSAGGADRKNDDDGGHLIGTRFNGAPDSRNIDAQNANLNRSSYNQREKSWQNSINNGDKVYVNIETTKSNGSERPDAYMGYSITEHPDGSREWDAFSYQNTSKSEQELWNKELDAFDNENPEPYSNSVEENDEDIELSRLDDENQSGGFNDMDEFETTENGSTNENISDKYEKLGGSEQF